MNVPELSAMVRQVMDVVTSKDLEQYVTRPSIKGGQRQLKLSEKSDALDEYQKELASRMEAIEGAKDRRRRATTSCCRSSMTVAMRLSTCALSTRT